MPRSIRAYRTVGNARKGPSSVRWITFAIIAAHISPADNVLRNDTLLDLPSQPREQLGLEFRGFAERVYRSLALGPCILARPDDLLPYDAGGLRWTNLH